MFILIYHAEIISRLLRKVKVFSRYFLAWSCSAVKARKSVIGQYLSHTYFQGDQPLSDAIAGSCYLNSLDQRFVVSQPTGTGHGPLLPAHNFEPTIESAKSSTLCCQVSRETFHYKMWWSCNKLLADCPTSPTHNSPKNCQNIIMTFHQLGSRLPNSQ